jgi:hypothetical protein
MLFLRFPPRSAPECGPNRQTLTAESPFDMESVSGIVIFPAKLRVAWF